MSHLTAVDRLDRGRLELIIGRSRNHGSQICPSVQSQEAPAMEVVSQLSELLTRLPHLSLPQEHLGRQTDQTADRKPLVTHVQMTVL